MLLGLERDVKKGVYPNMTLVLVSSCLLLLLAQYKHKTKIMYSHALSML